MLPGLFQEIYSLVPSLIQSCQLHAGKTTGPWKSCHNLLASSSSLIQRWDIAPEFLGLQLSDICLFAVKTFI